MLDNVDTSRGEQFVAGDVYDVNLAPSLLQSRFLTDNRFVASRNGDLICNTQDSKMDLGSGDR